MVNIRNYEVSIWTLQDSFITVLKQSNLENKGKIQDPQMVLKDDGDNTFSFKIPMYLQEDTDLAEKPYFKNESIWKENPIWYTVRNGNLIASLRKIKVIFNKGTADEEVFEFIINNIKESHEGYEKYCEVECGGLAFHELGKQGYEIVLSQEEFIADYKAWEINQEGDAPINRINYWVDKVLNNSNWTYIIDMDWSQYDGIINKNDRVGNSNIRQSDKIYREPYISSWELDSNNELIAASNVTDISKLEKLAYVEAKESNRYNLLQSIAEAFQVFCKFKYLYDDNYHIIGRQVIFYNNFINESEGVIDFNYGYNTSQITREMDGTDLVSKMYVKALSNSGTIAGEVYLSDSAANPTLDNFLLNFNYLYKIGTISQEQYDSIKVFQKDLYILNSELKTLNNDLIKYNKQIGREEVKKKTADDLYTQAGQRVASAEAELVAITSGSYPAGNKYTTSNPLSFTVISDSQNTSKAYVKLNKAFSRLHPSTLVLYKELKADNTVNTNSSIPTSKITFKKDSDGFINKITFPKDQILISNNTYLDTLYAIFEFDPNVPSQTIINIWNLKQGQAKEDSDAADEALNSEENGLYALVKNCEEQIKIKNAARKELIKSFERLMGPALREGTWQPEDDYADYQVTSFFTLNNGLPLNSITTSNEDASFIWDEELFYGEQKLSYGFGVNDTLYYPYIELTIEQWNSLHNLANLNLIYRDIYLTGYDSLHPMTDEKVNHYLQVGASNGCQFAFIKKSNGEIKPVLLVLGVEELLNATVNGSTYTPKRQIDAGNPRLRVISTTTDGIVEDTTSGIASVTLKQSNANDKIVYPRFKVKADRYLENYPDNKIYQNKTALKNSENYYELYRDGYYYVTVKNPELSKPYSFHYAMSTAAEAVYLDAIEVLRENSVPKVSYNMVPLAIEQTFMKNAYARLGQLAHINDQELKFENVQGYISEVDLNLDKPWEDNYIIKNYKTKFEDLFSTIVAQTEAMKKNSQLFSMVSNAFNTNGLLEDAIVDNIKDRLNLYIPTPAEVYAQYEEQIRDDLRQAFNDAGEVLAAAQNSVNDVSSLNVANATILGSFVENIKENMTPTTFNGSSRNKADFKVGDIWNNNGNVYLATENSKQLYPDGYPSNILTSLKGWSLVKDGSLAQIKGASLDVNTESGKIQLLAENEINIGTNGLLKLAGNNVQITGNKDVQIMGPELYLGSATTAINSSSNSGIHILASNVPETGSSSSSYVDITASGIEMKTANGIKMKAGGGIDISSSDGASTSAVRINKDEGIYLGTNKPLRLYSGPVSSNGSGASAELSTSRILFGVSNGSNGTAVEMTDKYFIIGAADVVQSGTTNSSGTGTKDMIGSNTGTAGVKITKTSIQLATGNYSTTASQNTRNYISMDSNGIKLANAANAGSGAVVSISQAGVKIGVASKASSFISQIKTGPEATDNTTAKFEVYSPNFVVDANGKLYAYGAYIAGDIYANSFNLAPGKTIPQNNIEGLNDSLSGLQNDINKTKAISAAITYAKSQDGVLNNNNPPSDIKNWSTSPVATDDSKPYLWTRTITTYASGNTSTSYSVSYKGKDGKNGRYVTKITPIYYLKTNSTAVPDPTTSLSSSDVANTWTKVIPTYQANATYYRSDMQEWSDGSAATFTAKYKDGGLTVANSTATSAVKRAAALASLMGHTFTNDGITSDENYSLKLTATKRMLIGANSGIDIWNTNEASGGTAVSLDSDGIALNGSAINLTATSGNSTSVISLNGNGIDLGATGTLKINTDNFKIGSNGDVSVTGTILATSGQIGDWIISNSSEGNHFYTKSLYSQFSTGTITYEVGLKAGTSSSAYAFYVKSRTLPWANANSVTTNIFAVRMNGEILATKGKIGNWTINDTSISAVNEKNTRGIILTSTAPESIVLKQDGADFIKIQTITNSDDEGYIFAVGDIVNSSTTSTNNSTSTDEQDNKTYRSGFGYYYRTKDGLHGWAEINGTIMLNGHRLYFGSQGDITAGSNDIAKYAKEKDIYWFVPQISGAQNPSSDAGWVEVKIYRKKFST